MITTTLWGGGCLKTSRRAPVSKWIQLARDRHQRDLEKGKDRGLWFDQAAVDRVDQFFGILPHYKGEWAGQSFQLAPWGGRSRTLSRPCLGGSGPTGPGAFGWRISRSPGRTGSPRWLPASGCTCWWLTANPGRRSTAPRPNGTRPRSSGATPTPWSRIPRAWGGTSNPRATTCRPADHVQI